MSLPLLFLSLSLLSLMMTMTMTMLLRCCFTSIQHLDKRTTIRLMISADERFYSLFFAQVLEEGRRDSRNPKP
jgi:hypothetical protein